MTDTAAVQKYIDANRERFLAELSDLAFGSGLRHRVSA